MKKVLLWGGGIVGALLLSVTALAAYVVLVLDPNDYKEDLSRVVKEHTDMNLEIRGQLAWQLWPKVGIKLGETVFSDPAQDEPLAAIASAAVAVELLPLLGGQVNVDQVLLDGAQVRFVQLAEGKTNWDRLLDKLQSDEPKEATGPVTLAVEQLDVRNTRLTLIDAMAGVTRELDDVRLNASGIAFGKPFPLSLGFSFRQQDEAQQDMNAVVSLDARVTTDPDAQRHLLEQVRLVADLSGSALPAPMAIETRLDSLQADLASAQHQLDGIKAQVSYRDPALVKPAELVLQVAGVSADLTAETVALRDLRLDASYQDKGRPAPITATLLTVADIDLAKGQANLAKVDLSAVLADAAMKGTLPAQLTAGLAANWKTGDIRLTQLKAKAANVELDADVRASLPALATGNADLMAGMSLNGRVSSNRFNPRELMKIAGIEAPKTAKADVLQQVSLSADLSGNAREILARNLRLTVDGSTVTGEAGVRELPNARLYARLNLDAMNVDHYLPPAEKSAAKPAAKPASAPTQAQAEALLPVALLREQNLDVGFTAGKLQVVDYPITQLRLAATARGGLVTVSELRGNVEGGSFSLPMTIDVRGAQPQISLNPVLREIDLGPIAKRATDQDILQGRFNFNGAVKVSGNSVDEWIRTAQGPNSLRVSDGLIKGINITDALLDALGQYQALLPALTGRDAASLRGRQSPDTQIIKLLGEVSLNQGTVQNESMVIDLQDIQATGSGRYNLVTQDVDYRFQLKLDRRFWGERFGKMAEHAIPVRCNGNLKGNMATLCGLDSQGMQRLVAQMAQARVAEEVDRGRQQIQEKIDEKLSDKLPPAQQEAVRQLFDAFRR